MEEQDNRLTIIASLIHNSMKKGVFGFDEIPLLTEAEQALNSIAMDISIRIPELIRERDNLNAQLILLQSQFNTSVTIDGERVDNEAGESPLIVGNEGDMISEQPKPTKKRSK